jgi:hypothetical protein
MNVRPSRRWECAFTDWLQATYVESDVTERAAREPTINSTKRSMTAWRRYALHRPAGGRIIPSFYDAQAGSSEPNSRPYCGRSNKSRQANLCRWKVPST